MNGDAEVLQQAFPYSRPAWKVAADFIELMKPELTSLSVLTAVCSFYLGHTGQWNIGALWLLSHLALGTTLVGGGAGALNQYLERNYDAMMKRTERRPLPSGHLLPGTVLLFGIFLSSMGLLELTFFVNALTGFLGVVTLTTYLFLYTPLKRISPVATTIGGIPGAIPPLMGWTAARDEITFGAMVLFAILFFWQMPHFFSLAWLYRKDYTQAGYRLLTVIDRSGARTSRHILGNCAALIPLSLVPSVIGMTSISYFIGALAAGIGFLVCGIMFAITFVAHQEENPARTNQSARRLFLASLVYLPVLFFLMVIDKV